MAEKILDNRLNIRNNCHIFNILCANVCKMGKKAERGQVPARQTPFDPNAQHKLHCAVKI